MKLSRLPPGFGLDTAAQGLALREGAVQDIAREWTDAGWQAVGTVQDGATGYHASVELTPPPDPQLRASSCTCGRYRCRHVAALVLSTDPPATCGALSVGVCPPRASLIHASSPASSGPRRSR